MGSFTASRKGFSYFPKISEGLLIQNVASPANGSRGPTEYFILKFLSMFHFIFAILLGLACPSHSNINNNNNATVMTGGDGGHVIPPPPPPPNSN